MALRGHAARCRTQMKRVLAKASSFTHTSPATRLRTWSSTPFSSGSTSRDKRPQLKQPAVAGSEGAAIEEQALDTLPATLHGFTAIRQEHVHEVNGTVTLFKHEQTGAELLAVLNDDPNKVFGITLRTPPEDSTGVPHILEHSCLGGSINYPLKETIVELIKTSQAEFVNAMTAPDRTMYPAASTNSIDFKNILSVYLDGVFNPLAVRSERGREIFRQEGHRLELDDTDSEPTLTGVVYQEMKGNYSNADTVASRTAQRCLFENKYSTYAVESGGHPADIPALTYEQFHDFHSRYYHPSNCRFFLYGDDAQLLKESMNMVNNTIKDFQPRSVNDTMVNTQPLWSEGKYMQEPYPASAEETKRYVFVNWLLSDKPLQDENRLLWEMTNHLLLGTSASPLRKALEESGYGEKVMGDGLEDELASPFFCIGLKGVAPENVLDVANLIDSNLERVCNEGFSQKEIEASQHAIEFALRENNTGRIPQGMAAMMATLTTWLYDGDAFAPLRWEEPMEDLKKRVFGKQEDPFTPLIKSMLNNPHKVTLEMYPDPNFGRNLEEKEKVYVENAVSQMSKSDAEQLVQQTHELRRKQQEPDDPETRNLIPTLQIDDLPMTPKTVPTNVEQKDGYESLTHPIFTRGIAYADVLLDMHTIPSRLLPLVPLFCTALTELGTQDMSPDDLQMRINSKTGGVSFSPTVNSLRHSYDPAAYIACRGKAVTDRSGEMFSLIHDILHGVNFDKQHKFKQLVLESKSSMEQRMVGAGHSMAAARMGAMNTLAGFVNEQMSGVSQLQYLRELAERVDNDWESVKSDLEAIRSALLNRANAKVNITASEQDLDVVDAKATGLMHTMPNAVHAQGDWHSISLMPKMNEALIVPTTVNYVGKSASLYDVAGYNLHGSQQAINKALSMSYLWEQVRASGGAYGVFGQFNPLSGMQTFVSFRDPNFSRTLDVYDGVPNYLRTSELTDDEVTRSVIGAIGDLDKHELPDAQGFSALMRYVQGITDEERQERRNELLSTSVEHFREYAEHLEQVKQHGNVVAVASEDDAQTVQNEKPELQLQLNKVL